MLSRKLVVVFALILAPQLAVAQDGPKYGHEFHHDFRVNPLPAELELFGKDIDQYAKLEPGGLRITLPKDRANLQPVGVKTMFPIRGDFEITFAVEILKAETPGQAFGVGSTIYVNRSAAMTEGSTFGRLLRAGDKEVIAWDRSPGKNSKFEGNSTPCTEKLVRLRLKRTGATWTYQWAPGMSDEFNTVNSWDFATDELKQVTLRCSSSGQPRDVEVRFLDLRVRSDGKLAGAPPGVRTVENEAPPAKDAPPPAGSKGWLIAAVGTGLILVVTLALVVGIWFVFRQRGEPAAANKEAGK